MKKENQPWWIVAAALFCSCLVAHAQDHKAQAANPGALREPAKTVLADYESIQQALAGDSIKPVAEKASDIARSVREDKGKTLSLSVAERADTLAHANSLKAARDAFKPLSESLVLYLDENKVKSTGLKAVYCPMVKASWLQKGEEVRNPYMGKSMLTCGEVRKSF